MSMSNVLRMIVAVLALGFPAIASADPAEPGCRPEMAYLRRPAPPTPFIRTNLEKEQVRLTFIGHATFLIETPAGVAIATDYNDHVRPRRVPDIATMNKAHGTHFSHRPDPAIRHVLPGWNTGGPGPARHDLTERDVRVRNVPTNIRSWGGDTELDSNSIFVFEIGELCIAHLGHLHHPLEAEHLRALGRVDIVLFPVDGSYTLDQEGMLEVLTKLQARLMIPMHFFGGSSLSRFLGRAQDRWVVERRDQPSLIVSKVSLPASPTLLVLPGH